MALADKMQIPALTVIARYIPTPSMTWVRTDRSGILFPTRRQFLQGCCPDARHALLSRQSRHGDIAWRRASIPSPPTRFPTRTDVVVIGGGIIGTSTALFLARKGVPVVLCEKGHIAGEQSSRNWGWCRKMGRDPREIPLAIESLRLWRGDERADRGGDRLPPVRHRLSVRDAETELAKREAWLEQARPYQLDTPDAVARRDRRSVLPGLTGDWPGGALHAERRPRRTAEGGAGDRRGGAAARRRRC